MKNSLVLLFVLLCSLSSWAQEKVVLSDIENYLDKEITICPQTADFDSKTGYTYLYFGGFYPYQKLTIAIKRFNGKKPIKLKMDILLGREIACYTGTVVRYSGTPDSTDNFGAEKIKKELETDRLMMIGDKQFTGHVGTFVPRTTPVNLEGKLVMFITDQKQISKKTRRAARSRY